MVTQDLQQRVNEDTVRLSRRPTAVSPDWMPSFSFLYNHQHNNSVEQQAASSPSSSAVPFVSENWARLQNLRLIVALKVRVRFWAGFRQVVWQLAATFVLKTIPGRRSKQIWWNLALNVQTATYSISAMTLCPKHNTIGSSHSVYRHQRQVRIIHFKVDKGKHERAASSYISPLTCSYPLLYVT